MCEKILNRKNNLRNENKLNQDIIKRKAIGLSSAIESAVGFWNQKSDSLNLKILSRYYALLHFTIAEQVSSLENNYGLKEIQKHTEYGGHGLGTIRNEEASFPENFYSYVKNGGHFFSYSKFLDYDVKKIRIEKRIRKYSEVAKEDKLKLVSLVDLLRRIPELQPLIEEYFNLSPLSFQISYSNKNRKKNSIEGKNKISYLSINTKTELTDLDFFNNLDLPFKKIYQEDKSDRSRYMAELEHNSEVEWYNHLKLYKSSYCGTSLIVPMYENVQDYTTINFMLMYSLSIIVRYLPDLWYEINNGELDHIASLLKYYLSIFDKVIPLKILERITGKKIRITMPGSLFGPI